MFNCIFKKLHGTPSGSIFNIWQKKNKPTVLIIISVMYLLTSCRTRNEASLIYPICGQPYEECSPEMSAYNSVQLRSNGQNPSLALALAASGGDRKCEDALRRLGRGSTRAINMGSQSIHGSR